MDKAVLEYEFNDFMRRQGLDNSLAEKDPATVRLLLWKAFKSGYNLAEYESGYYDSGEQDEKVL